MKLFFFSISILALVMTGSASAKAPKNLILAESDVAVIHTAIGFTTMLTFDSRPGTVILGDQDAFKVEYAGNGLAIKPVIPHAGTNLFVFTDYDRYSFKLVTGPTNEADYVLKINRPQPQGYPIENSDKKTDSDARLMRKSIGKKSECGGLKVTVDKVAWPESQSSFLVQFKVEASPKILRNGALSFEPGDIGIRQGTTLLPIQSLYLERLFFNDRQRTVLGTLVLRQVDLKKDSLLTLEFLPDFHLSKYPECPSVSFSRQGSHPSIKRTNGVTAPMVKPSA